MPAYSYSVPNGTLFLSFNHLIIILFRPPSGFSGCSGVFAYDDVPETAVSTCRDVSGCSWTCGSVPPVEICL